MPEPKPELMLKPIEIPEGLSEEQRIHAKAFKQQVEGDPQAVIQALDQLDLPDGRTSHSGRYFSSDLFKEVYGPYREGRPEERAKISTAIQNPSAAAADLKFRTMLAKAPSGSVVFIFPEKSSVY